MLPHPWRDHPNKVVGPYLCSIGTIWVESHGRLNWAVVLQLDPFICRVYLWNTDCPKSVDPLVAFCSIDRPYLFNILMSPLHSACLPSRNLAQQESHYHSFLRYLSVSTGIATAAILVDYFRPDFHAMTRSWRVIAVRPQICHLRAEILDCHCGVDLYVRQTML